MGDLDNDMDELFRKAANHYPLKIDGADWDNIIGKLPDAVGTPLPFTEPKSKTTNKKLLWLILLFPMGWLCNSYYYESKKIDENGKNIQLIPSNKKLNKTLQLTDNQKKYNEYNTTKSNKVITLAQHFKVYITTKNNLNVPVNHSNSFRLSYLQSNKNIEKIDFINNDVKINDSENDKEKGLRNNGQLSLVNPTSHPLVNSIGIDTDTITKLASNNNDSLHPQNIGTTKNILTTSAPKNTAKTKGFYLSALGGVDASSVKSQGVKKAGYGLGLLIGYQFNKRIAVETGLMWDKKQYYTNGEYFNKTRSAIPNTITILYMNGNCNMFELPISFRYNFAQNKKALFFGTAGLSSYFMKTEAYDYEASGWGSQWPAMKTYDNSGNNLFSIINLSVGYEHKIGRVASVRINPYLKIPLKGLGIGSLPIMSSGLNIGITVPFHK